MAKSETPSSRGSRSSTTRAKQEMAVGGFDRTPPQNIEAEQSVLGAMMLSPDAVVDAVDAVRGEDFYRPAHELVFDAIGHLFAMNTPADAITVAAYLKEQGTLTRAGGAEYLHTLLETVPTTASAGYYARIVHEQALLRRLVEVGVRITQMGYQAEGEVSSIIDVAQEEVFAVDKKIGAETIHPVGDDVDAAIERISATQENPGVMRGLSTGFRDLDATIGGLQPGHLVVVAGRPSVGKSTLALDFARQVSVVGGTPAVIFTLEMTGEELAERLMAAHGGVSLTKMHHGKLNQSEWEKVAKAGGQVSASPLLIDEGPATTVMDIRATCRKLQRQGGLGLVVVDYLQLMSSTKKTERREQEVAEFSRSLKLLAKELGVPVVAVSQLNRSPESRADKRPLLSDLRESGAIEQDADVVVFVHREDLYDSEVRPGESDLIVAKNRSGKTATHPVAHRHDYGRHQDMASEVGL